MGYFILMATQQPKIVLAEGAPTPLHSRAAENLRYIRSTIEAAHTFTTVPGKGCVAMGLVALTAAALESTPQLERYWLPIWLIAAVIACAVALSMMQAKARRQGLSLRRTVALRFFLTLAPAYAAGGVLTAALLDTVGRDAIAAIWLLLYGAGMAACGTFSIRVVLIAGLAFMGLGTVTFLAPSAWAPGMLALGFGVTHIVLGTLVIKNHGG
jgi:hypothetical protein